MTHVSRNYADQIAKDRSKIVDEIIRRAGPAPPTTTLTTRLRELAERMANETASPAAVTEERIAEIRADRFVTRSAIDDLLAAIDARGLELARVRAQRDEQTQSKLRMCAKLEDAEARLAQANEAIARLTTGVVVIEDGWYSCPGCGCDEKGPHVETCSALANLRAGAALMQKYFPTPPAQSAGEALDPAGTDYLVALSCGMASSKAQLQASALITAQASALAEARQAGINAVVSHFRITIGSNMHGLITGLEVAREIERALTEPQHGNG